MRPQEYNFYVGQLLSTVFQKGKKLDPDNGKMSSDVAYSTSEEINIQGTKALYVNCNSAGQAYVVFYNSNSQYISANSLGNNTTKDELILVPDNTAYMAFTYPNDEVNFINLQDSNKDFIYSLVECKPHYSNLTKTFAKENGQQFFRQKLNESIRLFGEDFNYIAKKSIEQEFIFIICRPKEYTLFRKHHKAIYYKGTFTKTDCKFNHSAKSCEVKVDTLDEYVDFLANYKNTYNLIATAPAITPVIATKRPLVQVYVKGADVITTFLGGTYWEHDVNEPIDDINLLQNKYHFAYVGGGTECRISGAIDDNINGVYAGKDGVWYNNKGYRLYFKTNGMSSGDRAAGYICLSPDNSDSILYESQFPLYGPAGTAGTPAGVIGLPDCQLNSKTNITMINKADSNRRFIIYSNTIFNYEVYHRMLCDLKTIPTDTGTQETYDIPYDDFVEDNNNYKYCIGLAGGRFFCSSATSKEPTKFGMTDDGTYFTDKIGDLAILGIDRVLPLAKSSWANASMWYAYEVPYPLWEETLRKEFKIKDTYRIGDAIKALLKKVDPTITFECTSEYSEFLYSAVNPIYSTKFYVHVAPKSNILKGEYDQAAQKADTSLEALLNMLRDCFKCYWFIDNNKLRIEHIYYFLNGLSYTAKIPIVYDFNNLPDQFNKKAITYFQTEVEYNKNDLPKRYEFDWADPSTELFGGVSLESEAKYVQADKKEDITLSDFSADIDLMLLNPANFSNDGFALLCPVMSNGYYKLPIVKVPNVIDDIGNKFKASIQNYYASWLSLQLAYLYDAPSTIMVSNRSGKLYASYIKFFMTSQIKFACPVDFDLYKHIQTEIGEGVIDEVSINLTTRSVTAKLIYSPFAK